MARVYSHRRKPMAQINVVPYIDVMLVLLVIFMVTAPLFYQGVEVNLPTAPAEPIQELLNETKEPLIVTIDKEGRISANLIRESGKTFDLSEFEQLAPGLIAQAQGTGTYIRGDTGVDYGQVVRVMVALQAAGAQNIGLITQPDNQ